MRPGAAESFERHRIAKESDMKTNPREMRWIILCTDGRHVTVGRHSDPSPEEIVGAEAMLAAQGLAGWLVMMEGGYYQRRKPALLMVRPLCDPKTPFSEAVEAFQAAREVTLSATR